MRLLELAAQAIPVLNDGGLCASELFALAEFKPRRQGENRQKRYLNGTYGAIPDLSMRLFEQAIASRADTNAAM